MTDDTHRSFRFTPTEPVTLRLLSHDADVVITHESHGREVTIELNASNAANAADLAAVTAECQQGVVELTIPPLLSNTTGRGFAIQLGSLSFSLGHTAQVTAEVSLPAGAHLELNQKSGETTVWGTSGDVRATTKSGDISLEEVTGELRVTSGSGDLNVQSCRDAAITTGSGDVSIDVVDAAEFTLTSGSADVLVEQARGALAITSGSGDITVHSLSAGEVNATSGTGDITITVPAGVPVWQDIECLRGDLSLNLSPRGEAHDGQDHVRITARTSTGDLSLADA